MSRSIGIIYTCVHAIDNNFEGIKNEIWMKNVRSTKFSRLLYWFPATLLQMWLICHIIALLGIVKSLSNFQTIGVALARAQNALRRDIILRVVVGHWVAENKRKFFSIRSKKQSTTVTFGNFLIIFLIIK